MSSTPITGKLDEALSTQSVALKLRVQRQQVLASNIANADTPSYKAVDFDFASAMRSATGGGSAIAPLRVAVPMAATAPGHIQASQSAYSGLSTEYKMQYRTPSQPAADGNSVDMDLERARFAENSVKYEAALKFLNDDIKSMLSALQG